MPLKKLEKGINVKIRDMSNEEYSNLRIMVDGIINVMDKDNKIKNATKKIKQ